MGRESEFVCPVKLCRMQLGWLIFPGAARGSGCQRRGDSSGRNVEMVGVLKVLVEFGVGGGGGVDAVES